MPAEFIYTAYKLARHYPPDKTVLEDISISFYPGAKIGVIGSNGAGKSSLLRIMAGLDDGINAADAWNLERNVDIAMDALRCPPDDGEVSTLSGGEKRRVALCRLLLQHPDLLLLDEPTNHLDAESVEWLERFLGEYAGTVVAVTHDRYFLDNVAKWILELDRR